MSVEGILNLANCFTTLIAVFAQFCSYYLSFHYSLAINAKHPRAIQMKKQRHPVTRKHLIIIQTASKKSISIAIHSSFVFPWLQSKDMKNATMTHTYHSRASTATTASKIRR